MGGVLSDERCGVRICCRSNSADDDCFMPIPILSGSSGMHAGFEFNLNHYWFSGRSRVNNSEGIAAATLLDP